MTTRVEEATPTPPKAEEAKTASKNAIESIVVLWPLILGLAFGRAGLIAACYGSYENTDEGLFTDGAMLVSLAALLIPFVIITLRKKEIGKPWANRLARICIVLEAVIIAAIGVVNLFTPENFALRFLLSVACTITASGSMFYWLRRARGTSASIAAVYVFAALIISEIELLIAALLPAGIDCFFTAALAALQLPCILWARKRTQPYDIEVGELATDDFFGFTENILKSRQLLIALATGICLLSIVTGFLRGYPNGDAIPFALATRIGYAVLVIVAGLTIIATTTRGNAHVLSRGVFIAIELIACTALICYAAFPDALDIGAMFITLLNALMVGFSWYIIIAFMSYGWRDPYYYAIAGWLVWLGARACSRMILFGIEPVSGNSLLFFALMGTLLVAAGQIFLLQFIKTEQASSAEEAQPPRTIVRIMGLDSHDNLEDMRQNAMRHSAEIMGEQFMLSEREVDVLALYATGLTQKKVAEELFITPSTAHAHIKRIYAKTGMHSRQDILDYIKEYAS